MISNYSQTLEYFHLLLLVDATVTLVYDRADGRRQASVIGD